MNLAGDIIPHLVHVGAILYLVCFLFRDQIPLRIFAVAGDVAYTIYYYGVTERPLWEAMIWSGLNIAINLVMISILLRDRRMTLFSDDELALYQNLKGLNPGQFRRLLRLGRWQKLEAPLQLTSENENLDRLYYVLSGDIEVDKAGRKIKVDPAVFIGELAYLRRKPATATVTAKEGAVIVSWSHADLARATAKDFELNSALAILLNADLAEKVARA